MNSKFDHRKLSDLEQLQKTLTLWSGRTDRYTDTQTDTSNTRCTRIFDHSGGIKTKVDKHDEVRKNVMADMRNLAILYNAY
jgi:hypothetical protein